MHVAILDLQEMMYYIEHPAFNTVKAQSGSLKWTQTRRVIAVIVYFVERCGEA